MDDKRKPAPFTRRQFLRSTTAAGLLAGVQGLFPAFAWNQTGNPVAPRRREGNTDIVDITIERQRMELAGGEAHPITINGSVPGPIIRLQEGRNAVLRVHNRLDEDTSIHWHGILLPFEMDGVPGVSFPGIPPGETFEARFPVKQSGTYWYHSHSGLQEQLGQYGALVIDPAEEDSGTPDYDREYSVVLSDWTFEDPHDVFRKLTVAEGYYNYHKRTVWDLFQDVEQKGWQETWAERTAWGDMRMSSRDMLDVTGAAYTYLINGLGPEANWTGQFRPGERVRLRFINASAMTFFDIRIPGLKMTVIEADGQPVEPAAVDEFRFGVAETYDVLVEPTEDRAYTLVAEAMDRSGMGRATLAPRAGMAAEIPELRPTPGRDLEDMGMGPGMMDMGGGSGSMEGGDGGDMGHGGMGGMGASGPQDWVLNGRKVMHGPDKHGAGAAMVAMNPQYRLSDPGVGLQEVEHKVLTYEDLKARRPYPDQREPEREIELHLTGNMGRYMWSFDGDQFSDADGPIRFHHGERLRLIMVNDTMMDHPIHLHGMWMHLENRHGGLIPRKHTIVVKPGEMLSAQIHADAAGYWFFHCHLLYHLHAGMARVVHVA
ncbi:copper resistance protein CopA [Thiohalorhabdus denitrificans]|uniref:Copper-resistance protein, CopA family n=1 Tax=Thiohalorhabdus denitrificans TaxID=381306 RepID=A0A0P9CSI0_9GAMM|nr:copper resistance system multicopper oxidase [Thiohalorhabdus denitrificans]KPV39646.1 copper resistance protein CopA [Thiohalorhabdus denitrificans]SCX95675.1 copper-resistance protein, CopA family [Thiohalorhabdus denitrificans]